MLTIWLIEDFLADVGDVQTAFLHGDLVEEIFIKIPSGYLEYMAILEVAMEILYVVGILRFLGVNVKFPSGSES